MSMAEYLSSNFDHFGDMLNLGTSKLRLGFPSSFRAIVRCCKFNVAQLYTLARGASRTRELHMLAYSRVESALACQYGQQPVQEHCLFDRICRK